MREKIVLLGAEVPSGRAIARKLRAEQYSCVLLPSYASPEAIQALSPAGIVLAGETGEGATMPSKALLEIGLPVLAIGCAATALLGQLGEEKVGESLAERVVTITYKQDASLFVDIGSGERWIAYAGRFDVQAPYRVIAEGDGVPLAYGNDDAKVYLLQFQLERNDPDGTSILRTFAGDVCGCEPWWTPENIRQEALDRITGAIGDRQAICAMSGGLDSTVAALLAREAIGDRAHCVFVDTGLLREGEAEETEAYFRDDLGLDLRRVDASERILQSLSGLVQMEAKWRVIEQAIAEALCQAAKETDVPVIFIKGTNYLDMATGAPQVDSDIPSIEPLGDLFKDEIRMLGETLGISEHVLRRQPFPGMGLAARIRGEVTKARIEMLRRADAIFSGEMAESGQDKRLSRYFAMLSQADGADVILLRAMQGAEPSMSAARLPYDLLERTVEQVQKDLPSVARVLYDITPGMAEWPVG